MLLVRDFVRKKGKHKTRLKMGTNKESQGHEKTRDIQKRVVPDVQYLDSGEAKRMFRLQAWLLCNPVTQSPSSSETECIRSDKTLAC